MYIWHAHGKLTWFRGVQVEKGLIECCYLSSRCKVHKISDVHFLLPLAPWLASSPVLRLILMCLQGVANQQTFTSSAQLQPFEQSSSIKFTQPHFPPKERERIELDFFFLPSREANFQSVIFFMLVALCVGKLQFCLHFWRVEAEFVVLQMLQYYTIINSSRFMLGWHATL